MLSRWLKNLMHACCFMIHLTNIQVPLPTQKRPSVKAHSRCLMRQKYVKCKRKKEYIHRQNTRLQ